MGVQSLAQYFRGGRMLEGGCRCDLRNLNQEFLRLSLGSKGLGMPPLKDPGCPPTRLPPSLHQPIPWSRARPSCRHSLPSQAAGPPPKGAPVTAFWEAGLGSGTSQAQGTTAPCEWEGCAQPQGGAEPAEPQSTKPSRLLPVVILRARGAPGWTRSSLYVFFGLFTVLRRGTHPVTWTRPPDG